MPMSNRLKVMLILTLLPVLPAVNAESSIQSLRGNNPLQNVSKHPEIKRLQTDRGPIDRQFVQQPPLIPHSIKGYRINLKFNKCLTCHSWANARDSGSTKISLTHFTGRDGRDLANVSASRYFCVQCHVTQKDAKPLVDNQFKPIKLLR